MKPIYVWPESKLSARAKLVMWENRHRSVFTHSIAFAAGAFAATVVMHFLLM